MKQHPKDTVCASCGGSGRVADQTMRSRGRKGGNVTYAKSLGPDQLSMGERGQLGGRPRRKTLAEKEARAQELGLADYF